MFERILNFSKKNLSTHNLIFKHFKIRWNIFRFILILTVIYGVALSVLVAQSKLRILEFPVLLPLINFFGFFFYINSLAKKVLKRKHKKIPEGYLWRDIAFDELQIELLYEYLKSNKLDSESKIKHIINLTYKEADEKKYSGFIWPGIILATFVPLWTQLITWAYKQAITIQDA